MSIYTDLRFFLSSDVALDLKVYVSRIKVPEPVWFKYRMPGSRVSGPEEAYVALEVLSEGVSLHSVAKSTRLPDSQAPWLVFEEWITLPIKIRDLMPTSQLAISVIGPGDALLYSKMIRIFDRKMRLKRGLQRVEAVAAADLPARSVPTSDLCLDPVGDDDVIVIDASLAEEEEESLFACMPAGSDDEYFRLLKMKEKYDHGEMPRASWLDRMTFRQLESMRLGLTTALASPTPVPPEDSWEVYLEFPYFQYPVVFDEVVYDNADATEVPILPSAASAEKTVAGQWTDRLCVIPDPEARSDNPAEMKYYKMNRGIMKEFRDKHLRPNLGDKEKLTTIVTSPGWKLTKDELQLLWNFRYFLSTDPKALPKFVASVDWEDELQVKEAAELLSAWAPIAVEDALGLLLPDFTHTVVREFAVATLARGTDEELLSYLLQLVQALRYEPMLAREPTADVAASTGDPTAAGKYRLSPLADFLIARATASIEIANYLSWYLTVEIEDEKMGSMFSRVNLALTAAMESTPEGIAIIDKLMQQREILARIVAMGQEACANKRDRIGIKVEKLKKSLGPDGAYSDLAHLRSPFVLPLQPKLKISGIVAEHSRIFKSAMYPLALALSVHPSSGDDWCQAGDYSRMDATAEGTVTVTGPRTFRVIFKTGDDLRQDQLVMQLIRLMDGQLKKVGLDLQLSPYTVLATSCRAGCMEMVLNSPTVMEILNDNGNNIQAYFKKHHPSEKDPYGISAKVMDTYIKSCAGYCVITFLLSIGDRHLENVLLTPDGHLVHIDFGYSFGNDPKPFPPPMKLTKEMVIGMGGPNSTHYKAFLSFCLQAYRVLRKSANLVLNLVRLMKDAGIRDLSTDPATTMMKLQDNFRLEIGDEDAEYFFLDMIEQSVTSFFPVMAEIIHAIAVSMRR